MESVSTHPRIGQEISTNEILNEVFGERCNLKFLKQSIVSPGGCSSNGRNHLLGHEIFVRLNIRGEVVNGQKILNALTDFSFREKFDCLVLDGISHLSDKSLFQNPLFVNIGTTIWERPGLSPEIIQNLINLQKYCTLLFIELNEGLQINERNRDCICAQLDFLRSCNIKIALDDVLKVTSGMGVETDGLAKIKMLLAHVDVVKIDKSLTWALSARNGFSEEDISDSRKVFYELLDLLHQQRFVFQPKIVFEGIEDPRNFSDISHLVMNSGISEEFSERIFAQGYAYSLPNLTC